MSRVADIIAHAAILTDTPIEQISGRCRLHHLVDLRSAVVLIARERTVQSYPAIGRLLGGRDHSSIIHLERRAHNMIARRPDYAAFVAALREEVDAEPFDVPVPAHLRPGYVAPAPIEAVQTVPENLPFVPHRGKKNRNRFDNSDPIFARQERVLQCDMIDGSKALLKALAA